jgi:GNAT superfamily N-acetyltransferase
VNLTSIDLGLVDRVERVGLWGWPPTYVREEPDGWIQRATPGLDRGRSCHALTPRLGRLGDGELPEALERVRAWSAAHGIRGGLQITPLEVHGDLVPRLAAAGWEPIWKCWVMTADREEALARAESAAGARPALARAEDAVCARSQDVDAVDATAVDRLAWSADREVTADWRESWSVCAPRLNHELIDAHVATVFKRMDGRGIFGRLGVSASGIAVEDGVGEWAGLFSLVVREDLRGQGLGRHLVRSLLESTSAQRIYLQVTTDNAAALSLYEGLGFRRTHSYQHFLAPVGWAG